MFVRSESNIFSMFYAIFVRGRVEAIDGRIKDEVFFELIVIFLIQIAKFYILYPLLRLGGFCGKTDQFERYFCYLFVWNEFSVCCCGIAIVVFWVGGVRIRFQRFQAASYSIVFEKVLLITNYLLFFPLHFHNICKGISFLGIGDICILVSLKEIQTYSINQNIIQFAISFVDNCVMDCIFVFGAIHSFIWFFHIPH